jgi:hypothetical protein
VTGEQAQAEGFAELFRAVYLTFHRRDQPRSELHGASRAVLEHLALAGPLTIGEAAAHMGRAQSVISEIVTHLERDGHEALRRDRDVLGIDLVARAMTRLPPGQASALNAGMRALIECAQSDGAATYGGDSHDHEVKL